MRPSLHSVLLVCAASACGAAPTAPTGGPVSEPGSDGAAASAASVARAPETPAPASNAPGVAQPRPADLPAADSWPEGVSPLSEAEGAELGKQCKPFTDAVTTAAKKAGRSKGSVDIARDVLAHPPEVAGVDGARCADLMRRELTAYRARTIEQEAVVGLKRIALGMANHFAEAHGLCPSAPPVPAAVSYVAKEPYLARAEDWNDIAWTCLRFDQQGPQRFMYLVRVDVASGSYEAIARGYPVDGGAPAELYVRAQTEESGPPMNVVVMRRSTAK